MAKTPEAYIRVNAGVYYALQYPSQSQLVRSGSFKYALWKARKLGYAVRVYAGFGSQVYPPLLRLRSAKPRVRCPNIRTCKVKPARGQNLEKI